MTETDSSNDRVFDEVSTEVTATVVPSGNLSDSDTGESVAPDETWQIGRSRHSAAAGLGGLLAMQLFYSAMLFVFYVVSQEMSRRMPIPPRWLQAIASYALVFPPVVGGSLLIGSIALWRLSIIRRCLIALTLVVPYVASLLGIVMYASSGLYMPAVYSAIAATSSALIGAAVVGVLVQLFTPWVMTPAVVDSQKPAPIGTGSLFQLTAVIAGLIALAQASSSAFEDSGLVSAYVCIGFAFFGSGLAILGTALCISFLRRNQCARLGRWIFCVTTFAAVSCLSYAAVYGYSGWTNPLDVLPVTLPVACFGFSVVCFVLLVSVGWLRACGWRCIRRSEEARDAWSPTGTEAF